MAKEKTELRETKNAFKVIGKVSRIDKDGAFKEENVPVGQGRKREGEMCRSLRFGVKTSDTNEITVSMFDYEPQEVFLWNSKKRKENPNYKGDRVAFDEWLEREEELREEGYAVLQTRIGLEYGEDGKLQSKGVPSFVASKEIYDNINNGDAVVIEGSIRYSTYTNQQGKEVEQKTYTIKKLFKLKDIDFESEKFEEVSYFEQEFVFIDSVVDKKEKKAYITGRTIDYYKNWHDTQFVVNFSDGADGIDKDMETLAMAFDKKVKPYDLVKVFGDTLNRVIIEEKEDDTEENEEDKMLASLGGRSKPTHAQSYIARSYVVEMSILGVDAWDKKAYKEEDFEKEQLVQNEVSSLGGKQKSTNPFSADIDDEDEDSDDLPF